MKQLGRLLRLLKVYCTVSENTFTHLMLYDDFSGSICNFHGNEIAEFANLDEAEKQLIDLIQETAE